MRRVSNALATLILALCLALSVCNIIDSLLGQGGSSDGGGTGTGGDAGGSATSDSVAGLWAKTAAGSSGASLPKAQAFTIAADGSFYGGGIWGRSFGGAPLGAAPLGAAPLGALSYQIPLAPIL